MRDDSRSDDENSDKVSVTAPGQPVGPIVGVVSLIELTSFRY